MSRAAQQVNLSDRREMTMAFDIGCELVLWKIGPPPAISTLVATITCTVWVPIIHLISILQSIPISSFLFSTAQRERSSFADHCQHTDV